MSKDQPDPLRLLMDLNGRMDLNDPYKTIPQALKLIADYLRAAPVSREVWAAALLGREGRQIRKDMCEGRFESWNWMVNRLLSVAVEHDPEQARLIKELGGRLILPRILSGEWQQA